jgi:hypothetical protein
MVAVGRAFFDIFGRLRSKHLQYVSLTIILAVFVYTALFSIAYIRRMTRNDTRLECTEWVKENLGPRATMGAPNYAPLTYTPPIDMADIVLSPEDYGRTNDELFWTIRDIFLTDYDYDRLLQTAPEYYFITETERREYPYTDLDRKTCARFFERLFSENDYRLLKVYRRDFRALGIDFQPNFPNMEWNLVNQTIWVFKARE